MQTRRVRVLELLCRLYPLIPREKHLSSILCGEVVLGEETIRNPRELIPEDAPVQIRLNRYVSRGGYKLEHALNSWSISVEGEIILDAGASAGGFTDCLLQHGAKHVYAVDVGYNQIHPKLRKDTRVTVMEKTNIMKVNSLVPVPSGAVCDLSFRSLRKAARHILGITGEKWLIALVKPQFEWKNSTLEFDGVVRSESELQIILNSLREDLISEEIAVNKILESPLKGRYGNREFFFYLTVK